MFTYEEADVFVILDKDKKPWYHGKQIAEILHYKNTRDALCKHVDKKYKMSLADMTSRFATSIKMDVKTTFINNSGLFQLVSRSKKKKRLNFGNSLRKKYCLNYSQQEHIHLRQKNQTSRD